MVSELIPSLALPMGAPVLLTRFCARLNGASYPTFSAITMSLIQRWGEWLDAADSYKEIGNRAHAPGH
jgi:hypothetical protein